MKFLHVRLMENELLKKQYARVRLLDSCLDNKRKLERLLFYVCLLRKQIENEYLIEKVTEKNMIKKVHKALNNIFINMDKTKLF